MKDEPQASEKQIYSARGNFKLPFLVCCMLSFLCILVDSIFSGFFMRTSVNLSLFLQTFNLKSLCLVLNYGFFVILIGYVLFVYTISKNVQRSLIMITGICLMVYAQALLKLILIDHRPTFLDADLDDDWPVRHSLRALRQHHLYLYADRAWRGRQPLAGQRAAGCYDRCNRRARRYSCSNHAR